MDGYQALADAALSACPPGYDQLTLEAELYENSASMALECRNDQGHAVRSDMPGDSSVRVLLALEAIRQSMARQAGENWKSCVFTIGAGGHFNFRVSYDDRPPG